MSRRHRLAYRNNRANRFHRTVDGKYISNFRGTFTMKLVVCQRLTIDRPRRPVDNLDVTTVRRFA
jgi:hypothetical protein